MTGSFGASFGIGCLNNRYHDPTLGSFLSVDPLVRQTMEPYIYGSANPTTLSDPNGLCTDPGCWDFLGVVLRELTGQAEPGTTEERQEEYNALMASSMEQRMELLGPASWSSRDQLYYQQLTFGPTYELPTADVPRVSTVLGLVSDVSGVVGLACATAVVFAGASVVCAGPALAVSGAAGAAEAVALLVEGDESGQCKAAVAAVDGILPGPVGAGALAEGVFHVTRTLSGFGAGASCG